MNRKSIVLMLGLLVGLPCQIEASIWTPLPENEINRRVINMDECFPSPGKSVLKAVETGVLSLPFILPLILCNEKETIYLAIGTALNANRSLLLNNILVVTTLNTRDKDINGNPVLDQYGNENIVKDPHIIINPKIRYACNLMVPALAAVLLHSVAKWQSS